MDRERCIDETVVAEREHSSQQCLLPGTSAPCSGKLHACDARSTAALMPAASPSRSAGTMARSTVVPPSPAQFPGPCVDPARIPPHMQRSFERGFRSSCSFFLSCPFTCRISNEFACFKVSIGTKLKRRVIVDSNSHTAFSREPTMAPMPIFVRRLAGFPPADFLVTSWGAGASPLLSGS
jgi:hypothetical protein